MSRILLIETSTALCSVALADGGRIVASRESDIPRTHAAMTAPFVKEVLSSQGLAAADCDAVCVSAGPGSYTGLRVGVSTAKGLCFAAGIPLLSVGTLDILALQAIERGLPEECRAIVPLVDARRMEVYTAVFSPEGGRETQVEPRVIDSGSFGEELAAGRVVFIGDGAEKCSEVIKSPNAVFIRDYPRASAMAAPAQEAFDRGEFRDCAYFEPFYLKQFVATVSKKNLF